MGRTTGGVEVREASIRLSFTAGGVRYRTTLMIDGAAVLPTPANIKYANRLMAEVSARIKAGTFDMMEYFPQGATSVKRGAASHTPAVEPPVEPPVRRSTRAASAQPPSEEPGEASTKRKVQEHASAAPTVEAWLTQWLDMTRIETSTRIGYDAAVKFWCRASCDNRARKMGSLPLAALKLSHILTAIASRRELSGKTINNYVSVLRLALGVAVADQLMPTNIAESVSRAKHQRQPTDPFSREESEAIIAEAAKVDAQIHNYIELWFWSGLRTSEINGLEWRFVDFKDNTIAIERVLVAGEEKNRTKTAEARLVRLNSRAYAALQRQRAFTQVAGGRVFQDPRTSKPWHSEEAFTRVYWSRILKRLGIRYRRPYNMRHSYATSMLMAGMTPAFCARQLGHTVEMFLRTYAKWIDGSQNDLEMARLENALTHASAPSRTATLC
ncbi:site-specific integrase [Caballeronia sp. AZ10_KS36]|uniref:site-specific integrase n=1 Tax=Caballeronia sp. AZ10_KS36 TaxID=2921757 RepID=UPI0020286DC5|nr:site-specific integrase [Caballeronia sp. AZ10_KS36]